ncbi:MAG: toxin-antitoxin system HicB family antitoxin [Mariprofundaceae bacterium]
MLEHYTYRVTWSEEDQMYIGLCAEMPSLSWLADSHEKALKGVFNTVKDVVADMLKNNEAVPVAISERKFSGSFKLRVPPQKHRELVIHASEQGVSLNRYINALI